LTARPTAKVAWPVSIRSVFGRLLRWTLHIPLSRLTGRPAVRAAGLALIILGIVGLYLSYAILQGWWQGTSQALGVGFFVGGVVDVLAISSLDRIIQNDELKRARINDQADALASQMTTTSVSAITDNTYSIRKQLPSWESNLDQIRRLIENPPEELEPRVLASLNYAHRLGLAYITVARKKLNRVDSEVGSDIHSLWTKANRPEKQRNLARHAIPVTLGFAFGIAAAIQRRRRRS
jgi:hypothetical protein